MSDAEAGKRAAAEAAIRLVENGMRLGLGTGSTMYYAVEALGRRVREEGLQVIGIPTSRRTEEQARQCGIPLSNFAQLERLDLAIDGADEVHAETLALIKGLGGALLREKIVAVNADRFVVVADESKVVQVLGSKAPVPVEVVAFGHEAVARRLASLGVMPELRRGPAGEPFVTDGGNVIYDCRGCAPIDDPAALDAQLSSIVGVIETGIFPSIASEAIISKGDSVRVIRCR